MRRKTEKNPTPKSTKQGPRESNATVPYRSLTRGVTTEWFLGGSYL